jgi:2-keto-4-pentenoate hydratase
MSDERHARAAWTLWDAWCDGHTLQELPAEQRPADVSEGYQIQTELDHLAGERIGWKLAATGAGGRAALGVEHPLTGPLYNRFSVMPGSGIDFGEIRMRTVEAEFGFVIANTLPAEQAPFERSAVLAALGPFLPAIEIPNTRYDNHRTVGGPQLVADAACAGLYVLGERVEGCDPDALAAHPVTLTTAGGEAQGTGGKVLGDPVEAVRWLANELASRGRVLSAGEVVITGAAAAVKDPGAGRVRADFGLLGTLEVELRPI